jgi:hypothetical protein
MSLTVHTIYRYVIAPGGIALCSSYFAIFIYSRGRGKLDEKAAVIASLRAAFLVAFIAGICLWGERLLAADRIQREHHSNGPPVEHSNEDTTQDRVVR